MNSQPHNPETYLINDDEFRRLLGQFVVTNNVLDLTVDLALCKFLRVTSEEAHILASGMSFGKKARLLRDLVRRSDHKNKAAILGSFNALTSNGKRDVLVHSLIRADGNDVVFVERPGGGDYTAKTHHFSKEQFRRHVTDFGEECVRFHNALGYSGREIDEFGDAALSASRKPTKAPEPPSSRA